MYRQTLLGLATGLTLVFQFGCSALQPIAARTAMPKPTSSLGIQTNKETFALYFTDIRFGKLPKDANAKSKSELLFDTVFTADDEFCYSMDVVKPINSAQLVEEIYKLPTSKPLAYRWNGSTIQPGNDTRCTTIPSFGLGPSVS